MTAALVLAALPALADTDMQLNTSNFVAGLTIRFDPSKVALSNLHADSSTTWSLMAYNTDHLAEGWAKAVLLNTADGGQTTDGPILLFTVTPVDSTVDVNDCATLSLSADESDYCDANYDDYQPTDACAPPTPSRGSADIRRIEPDTFTSSTGCDATDAVRTQARDILSIAAGINAATLDDIRAFDRDDDLQITMLDAVLYLRYYCSSEPEGWYTFQGNRRRTGRSLYDVSPSPGKQWRLTLGPAYASLPNLAASPIVVPNPAGGVSTVFAIATNGTNSTLLRVSDAGTTATITGTATFNNIVLTGTPLYRDSKVYLTGNGGSTGGGAGHLYVVNAWDAGSTMSPSVLYDFGGNVYSSPIIDPVSGGVLASANTSADTAGKLFCIDAASGTKLWDYAFPAAPNSDPPLYPSATFSSPSVTLNAAYVGDSTGDIFAVSLNTHTLAGSRVTLYNGFRVDSTPALMAGKLVAGGRAWYTNCGSPAATVTQYSILANGGLTSTPDFYRQQDATGVYFCNNWGTPAYFAEAGVGVWTDDQARTVGLNTDHDAQHTAAQVWQPSALRTQPTRCSILASGAPHSLSSYAFLGEDDGFIQVRDPNNGNLIGFFGDGSAALDGAVRSSLAAYKSRLYVLTTNGSLYCFQ